MHPSRFLILCVLLTPYTAAQTTSPATSQQPAATASTSTTNPSPAAREPFAPPPATPLRANILRGAYGPYRANNDLLYYHLDLRVDPVAKSIAGSNTVRFKMLTDGNPHPARP